MTLLLGEEVAEKLTGLMSDLSRPQWAAVSYSSWVWRSLKVPDSYSTLAFESKLLHVLGTTGRSTTKEMLCNGLNTAITCSSTLYLGLNEKMTAC